MQARTNLVLAHLVAAAALAPACVQHFTADPSVNISVSISPQTASVGAGGTVAFTAAVTGGTSTAVSWSVAESNGGTIDAAGKYTAPASAGVFHVVAASLVDPSISDAATVTVTAPIAVSVSPYVASVITGGTLAFSAAVTGAGTGQSTAVTWSVQETGGGTVDGSGHYLAPGTTGTYHVVATSVADSSKKGTAAVTVTATPVIAVAISPQTASTLVGGTASFSAIVTGTTTGQSTAVTWSVQEAAGGSVSGSGVYTAPGTAGTWHVVATSVADASKKDTATVTVTMPVISVSVSPHAASATVGSTASFSAVVTGAGSGQSTSVTWSVQEAGGGSVSSSGVYTAPSAAGTYHVVGTSVADPAKSDTATVTVYTSALIQPDRMTIWNPGLNSVGGIPNRATIYTTLSPRGGTLDDTAQVQAALDGCPANQVVKLNAGTFNINGNGLSFRSSDCTLRGSGTGTPGSGAGGTRLIKADRDTNPSFAVLYIGYDAGQFSSSTNLAADAVKGTNSLTLVSNPGIQVGEIVLVDHVTNSDPQVFWGPNHDPPGGGSRRWFIRQDRSLSQMLEVTAVSGKTITFATPFHITFKTAYTAQLSRYSQPVLHRTGLEDVYVYGGQGGDGHGNVAMNLCAYCWIKNIEAHWSVGTSVGFYSTYRSELRDSYIHETPDPNPGGAGYLTGLNQGASDNLIENNIMWYGNKTVVMRGTGGGNVFAYNYLEDSFGSTYPNMPEAGLNAGHYTTPHMELLEGNRSHSYQGDAFWGNSIYITVFRNHLTSVRGAIGPLATYKYDVYPYKDLDGRAPVRIEQHSFNHNLIGNVLGFQGQTLLSYSSPGYSYTQTGWLYEALTADPDTVIPMWKIGFGACGPSGCPPWLPSTVDSIQRDGNWDWVSKSQRWHGVGGAAGSGTPTTIPNSLYLSQKPAFFGSNPWPWVDPATGTVYTLPAKARFDAMSH